MVGLGNPGARSVRTRHNVGFRVLEELAARHGLTWTTGSRARTCQGRVDGVSVGLVQPLEFMNRSGAVARGALEELGLERPDQVLVVLDDADLPLGRLRLRPRGGDGGHRGLRDVLAELGSDDVPRLRFGIGRPEGDDAPAETTDWVLGEFTEAEERVLAEAVPRAADAVECCFSEGVTVAMNRFNRAPSEGPREEERAPGSAAPAEARAEARRYPAPAPAERDASMDLQTPQTNAGRTRLADLLARPFLRFMELEISSAILLLAMAVAALVWANSPWAHSYEDVWHHTMFGMQLGDVFELELSLGHWVNDGLMTIFFFVVGMEIKREMAYGELSTRARAMLPIAGALGGMIVPAAIYAAFHAGGPAIRGWGIPMATDIAFAVAALSVLGARVPSSLRVFLLALAIADDLGAVAVIAIFYTAEIHMSSLALAGAGLAFCAFLRWAGVRSFFAYVVVGAFVWFETHHSGVHATIAGVMLGFLTPAGVPVEDGSTLMERGRRALDHLTHLVTRDDADDHGGHQRVHAMRELSVVGRETISPLDFLVNLLERPVAFVIMPLFALSNAGVALDASTLGDPTARSVAIAVALGLVIGKPVGVTLFSWVAVKGNVAVLPNGVNWSALAATGLLAGIGFTVALFVTALAFENAVFTAGSKVGILVGSLVATVVGLAVLHRSLPQSSSRDR